MKSSIKREVLLHASSVGAIKIKSNQEADKIAANPFKIVMFYAPLRWGTHDVALIKTQDNYYLAAGSTAIDLLDIYILRTGNLVEA